MATGIRRLFDSLSALRPNSLRFKLLAMFGLVVAAISMFIFLYFPALHERLAVEGLEARSESVGAMTAFSARSAVVFDDRETMIEVLTGVMENEDILYVRLVNSENEPLAWLGSEEIEAVPTSSPVVVSGTNEQSVYHLATPIWFESRIIGEVRLGVSLVPLRAEVTRIRRTINLVSATIFALALIAFGIISRMVFGPLGKIVHTADQIARGDFSQRVGIDSDDEVGHLARSFDHMVDHLESARGELETAKIQLDRVLDNLPAEVAMFDLESRYLYVNSAGIENPLDRQWVIGKTPVDYCRKKGLPDRFARTTHEMLRQCLAARTTVGTEQAIPSPDGETRHLLYAYSPIQGDNGEVVQIIGYGLDVTERREAEEALRVTEERLRHTQKMESIGQLAGGVAHDFNNLLTAITGHADLLMLDLESGDPRRDDVGEILSAADSAARLTQQLLAFGRKQVLKPEVLDLNEVVGGIEKLVQRLIGEDVETTALFKANPATLKIDAGQLEQVIINLVVNARDAMSQGGSLTIETSSLDFQEMPMQAPPDIQPGPFVLLSVSDTGTGMDQATKQSLFEPFFTTKKNGEGTGLGLSTVHGIVQQSGGFIYVYSELGLGTTFKVYFPVADARLSDSAEQGEAPFERGAETLMVVEDQDNVRNLVCRILERHGYVVITADHPQHALQIAQEHEGPIDLLLTDVVMPQMSGRELAERVSSARPETAVLYMSGYTDDALLRRGILESDTAFLEKPFTSDKLASSVRKQLDASKKQPI